MLFTQLEFILFLSILGITVLFLRSNFSRKILLLAASYYFYCYWDYRFLVLLLMVTISDYLVGLRLGHEPGSFKRKCLLTASISLNLGMLCSFKYYNFFILNFGHLLEQFGLNVKTISIILPLGISFYTFKSMTYTIEVYRKDLNPTRSLLDYALFVAFFPTLIAGPIVRASHFLPQLRERRQITRAILGESVRLFIIGLFKKVFIADRLALFVDQFYAAPSLYNTPTTWLAAAAFTLQIYFDFSGYSDMAIGISRLLGYDVGTNFKFPYLAKNLSEFWQRWHISLSTWIRDYVYIPLGGKKKGPARTYLNLLLAMLLCGLWHGAAWTFVFWGFYHGLLLCLNRLRSSWRMGIIIDQGSVSPLLNWFLTFFLVLVGWVFFRAHDFSQASGIIRNMFIPSAGISWYHPFTLFMLAAVSLFHILEAMGSWEFHRLPLESRYTPFLLFCLLWLVLMFFPKTLNPFLYLKF